MGATRRRLHLSQFFCRPICWATSRYRHEWRLRIHSWAFEYRHWRRLRPLVLALVTVSVVWCLLLLALAVLLGGPRLIWNLAFAQNVLANFLVLPISLAIGVLLGALLYKHALRFQARHAGDALADCVSLTTLEFILFLRNECGLRIDIEGPVDHHLVEKARRVAQDAFRASSWSCQGLPLNFEVRLYETTERISSCFEQAADLRLAFPRAFDLERRLASLVAYIKKARHRSSPPTATAEILLSFAAQILKDLQ